MLKEKLEVITVGLPFCAFKLITGFHLIQIGSPWILSPIGILLCGFGVIDLILNLINLTSLAFIQKRSAPVCLITYITERTQGNLSTEAPQLRDFGNSIDLFVAFLLVALMVGFSQIAKLPPEQIHLWNLSVVLNVLGAGLSRITQSFSSSKS